MWCRAMYRGTNIKQYGTMQITCVEAISLRMKQKLITISNSYVKHARQMLKRGRQKMIYILTPAFPFVLNCFTAQDKIGMKLFHITYLHIYRSIYFHIKVISIMNFSSQVTSTERVNSRCRPI